MKKKFFGNNFRIIRYFDQRNLGSIPRFLIGTVMVMTFFYSMPILINFAEHENFEFKNNSKKVLAYTLSGKKNPIEGDNEILNENDLLVDIFSLNELETDTVRLNASTIKQFIIIKCSFILVLNICLSIS